MDRRGFLKGAGVVTVVVAGGGVWRAYESGVFSIGQGPAYEPWKNWREADGGRLGLVRAAILAASPHNTQPWLFNVTPAAIDLYLDTQRNVGALDPYLREEHIGIGCALENLMLAAAANGFSATASLEPGKLEAIPYDLRPRLVARVGLEPGMAPGHDLTTHDGTDLPWRRELYEAIPRRHTNRAAYDPHRPVPADFPEALAQLPGDDADVKLFLFSAEAERKKIAEVSAAANSEIYADPEVQRGSERWLRLKWSAVQEHRDGLTVDAFGLPPIAGATAKMMTPRMLQWAAANGEKDGYTKLMLSAPLIGFIAVRDRYERAQCLRAGRIWQRAHLLATARGVAARPCNEAVEMVDHERALGRPASRVALLNEITGDATWQPTFVFYMGYSTLAAHVSPRRSAESVLI